MSAGGPVGPVAMTLLTSVQVEAVLAIAAKTLRDPEGLAAELLPHLFIPVPTTQKEPTP